MKVDSSKRSKKVVTPGKRKGKKAPKRQGLPDLRRDIEAIARHISDPCNSDLSISGLPGQRGIISRFVSEINTTFGGGGSSFNNDLFFSYFPSNTTYALSNQTAITTFTPTLGQVSGPGSSFFNAENTPGNTFRPLGACVEVMNFTNIMNRGGTWGVLHTPANVIDGNPTTTSRLFAASNERGLFGSESEPLMFTWRPGYMDDTYSTWAGVGENVDFTDRNCLTLVMSGPEEVQSVRIRITLVCEWLPNIGLTTNGLVTPTAGGSTHNLRSSQVVSALDKAKPGWFGPMMKEYGMPILKNLGTQLLGMIAAV